MANALIICIGFTVVFGGLLFGVVYMKDALIEVLNERIDMQEKEITDLRLRLNEATRKLSARTGL